MAINPVDIAARTTALPDTGIRKYRTSSPLFDAVLNSARDAGGGSAAKAQKAAADLLRMEMMHSSLALTGDVDASQPSAITALESALSGLAAKGQAAPVKWQAYGRGGEESGLANAVAAPQAAQEGGGELDGIGKTAAELLGTPYRFGGNDVNGIDCSSFVQKVFHEHQIDLPRTAREQSKVGVDVPASELRKGDLVFFHTYASYPSHVGIYLGDGKMIHASSAKGEVTVTDMNSSYYRSRFLGAKRIA